MAENGELKASTIKMMLRPIWPVHKDITDRDEFNIRAKVMKLIPVLRANSEYEQFKEAANDSELLTGIDNELDIDDDMAHQLAKPTWLDLLQETGDDSGSIVTFIQDLDLVQADSKRSVYESARDNNNNVYGVVWQTATMRANFERFGGYVSLDMTKRAINKWLLPYMSVDM